MQFVVCLAAKDGMNSIVGAFLTLKYQNPENLVFQHLPVKGKNNNLYKNIRLEGIKGMRNG